MGAYKYDIYATKNIRPIGRWLRNGLWCIYHDCKLHLIAIQGNVNGDGYINDVMGPPLYSTPF